MTAAVGGDTAHHSVQSLLRAVEAVLADGAAPHAGAGPRRWEARGEALGTSRSVMPGEAREILAAVLEVPRLWPAVHGAVAIAPAQADEVLAAAWRRARGMPLAYAVGRAAFRHLDLHVDARVLIPRPETEQVVDVVLDLTSGQPGGTAVDIGTGSGAIALALAMEGRFDRIIATDVSSGALDVARENAHRLGRADPSLLRTPVEFRPGEGWAPVRDVRARAVVSNPPYIAYQEAPALPRDVRNWEPPIALFSGNGGMAMTAAMIDGAAAMLEPGGVLVLEIDARRAALTVALAASDGRYIGVSVRRDLAGRDRILTAFRKGP